MTDKPSQDHKTIGTQPVDQRRAKLQKSRKSRPKKKKIIIITIACVLSILILLACFFAFRILNGGGKLFNGNYFGVIFSNDKLQRDTHGRSNILIFGTSEDDEGHKGAKLADSIMVLSIDQDKKAANIISIPRDLWVHYDTSCSMGKEGKINAAYVCNLQDKKNNEDAASTAFAKQVGKVTGLEIQYYARVNYAFMRDTVNALGGIDVVIKSRDPRGIYDTKTGLRLQNGKNHINGEQALKLSRARGSAGGYGLERSNFDRERNQQIIIKSIQRKAVSSGTLTNPFRATNLVDSLGNNIATNIKDSEVRNVIKVASGIKADGIESLPLDDKANKLVKTSTHEGQSIVRPVRGLFDYSDIKAYITEAVQR